MGGQHLEIGLEGKVMNVGWSDLKMLSAELEWTESQYNWIASLFPYFGNPGGFGLGEQTARVTPSVAEDLDKLNEFMRKSGREEEIRSALRRINTCQL